MRGREMLPETKVIREYLAKNGDQTFTVAFEALKGMLPNLSRSKYDMTKQLWKKQSQNATHAVAVVASVSQNDSAPKRRTVQVESANLAEALQFVVSHGGLAKVQENIKARKEQIAKDEALVAVFSKVATQISKAS